MQKILNLLYLIMLLFNTHITSQTLDWAKSIGNTGFDQGYDIAVDYVGNVYTVGRFQGTVDFDPNEGTTTLTSEGAGTFSAFIQKLDVNGDLLWVRSVGGLGDAIINSIALDASGNIYLTGSADGVVDFDPSTEVVTLPTVGGSDIFVEKLDTNGNYIWAKRMGWKAFDAGNSIAVDAQGNVYITGTFRGAVDFDPGEEDLILIAGDNAVFIQKLDTDGDFIWTKQIGLVNYSSGLSIEVDEVGNIYTSGFFKALVDFDPNEGEAILDGGSLGAVFIQKLDVDGNYIWAKVLRINHFYSKVNTAIDGLGNIYVTGHFSSIANFDYPFNEFYLSSNGLTDAFLLKMDTASTIQWVKKIGGPGLDIGNGITIDNENNIYIAGSFQETVDFDVNEDVYELTALGERDIFIQKLSEAGELLWVGTISGGEEAHAWAMDSDTLGNVYTTGFFTGAADFNPNEELEILQSAGQYDYFIQKLKQEPLVGITESTLIKRITVSPNPTTGYFIIELPRNILNAQVDIVNGLGEVVYHRRMSKFQQEFNLCHLPSGIYYISIKTNSRKFLYGKVVLN